MTSNVVMALSGGALVGLAATTLLLSHGKTAGVSGIIDDAISLPRRSRGSDYALWFLAGLLGAGLIARFVAPQTLAASTKPLGVLFIAGLLVGYGTRLANGCTSGHGVCGTSRFSLRSIVATCTFVAAAVFVTVVAKNLVGVFT